MRLLPRANAPKNYSPLFIYKYHRAALVHTNTYSCQTMNSLQRPREEAEKASSNVTVILQKEVLA